MKKIEYEKYDIISFDIFDTLIFRNLHSPVDLFDLVELKYNKEFNKRINDFKEKRILAQSICKSKSIEEEITINDIYFELQNYYDLSVVKMLKKIELEVELLITQANYDIKEEYDKLIQNGKKIIIISDMYLEKETIKAILSKCGYNNYFKLYLSSDLKKKKSTGTIFRFVLDDLKLSSDKIIHIGDNKQNDYLMPKKFGIDSVLYRRPKVHDISCYTIPNYMYNNNVKKNNYFYNFGYSFLGLLLIAFVKWLKVEVDKSKNNKILFLSRDGYLIKKAFDLYTDQSYDSIYFYGSRRAIRIPSFIKCNNFDEILEKIHSPKNYGIFKKKLGIDELNLTKIEEKYGINDNCKIDDNSFNNSNFKEMLDELIPIIMHNSEKEYKEFLKYVDRYNLGKTINVVDIGWFGTMQESMNQMLDNVKTNGFYIGLVPNGPLQSFYNMKGFLFDKNHDTGLYQMQSSITSIFEFMFTAPHGSTKKYNSHCDIGVELYDYEFEHNVYNEHLNSIHEGALKFINDYMIIDKYFDFEYIPEKVFYPIKRLVQNPTKEDAVNWGNIEFNDNGKNFIAKPDKFIHYLLAPSKYIKDFKNSSWKIGFLRRSLPFMMKIYFLKNKSEDKK